MAAGPAVPARRLRMREQVICHCKAATIPTHTELLPGIRHPFRDPCQVAMVAELTVLRYTKPCGSFGCPAPESGAAVSRQHGRGSASENSKDLPRLGEDGGGKTAIGQPLVQGEQPRPRHSPQVLAFVYHALVFSEPLHSRGLLLISGGSLLWVYNLRTAAFLLTGSRSPMRRLLCTTLAVLDKTVPL